MSARKKACKRARIHDPERIRLDFPYDLALVERVKAIPGRRRK